MGNAEDGQNGWGIDGADGSDPQSESWFGPDPALALCCGFEPHCTASEHDGIYGRDVVHLAVEKDHFRKEDDVCPSENAEALSLPRKEEDEGKGYKKSCDKAEHLRLGLKVRQWREHDIAATFANIVH